MREFLASDLGAWGAGKRSPSMIVLNMSSAKNITRSERMNRVSHWNCFAVLLRRSVMIAAMALVRGWVGNAAMSFTPLKASILGSSRPYPSRGVCDARHKRHASLTSWSPSLERALRAYVLLIMVVSTPHAVEACAFHFSTVAPEAPLSRQIASSDTLIAARPGRDDPFRFTDIQVLKGQSAASGPPHLVDSASRRLLQAAPNKAVLFAKTADGPWKRLVLLDEKTRPIVSHMLAHADRWAAPSGAAARRDYAATLLANSDTRLRRIALRELDSLDYRTLRAGTYDVPEGQLLQGIANLQNQAFVPIQIQLLGLAGGPRAGMEVTRQVHRRVATGISANLGAWFAAAVELQGQSAIVELERVLNAQDRPLSRSQIEELVQALAVQSASGDPAVRGAARASLVQFVGRYPDASFLARAQALVSSVFTGAMTDMKSGSSALSILFAVSVAFLYGALHTLGPGHGKAVVISYFAGSGGSMRRGLLMGTQIAITHVLSAILVVFLLDLAVRQATGNAPSDYRMVRLASYALIATIGLAMLWRAFQSLLEVRRHDHSHHHGSHGCASCAALEGKAHGRTGWLAMAIGVVPCTGALLVMLYGLANDLVGPAIVMVAAISLGMAVAMAGLGIATIWGHNWAAARWKTNPVQRTRFAMGARFAGAAGVTAIGALLFTLTLSAPVGPLDTLAYGGTAQFDGRTVQMVGPAMK